MIRTIDSVKSRLTIIVIGALLQTACTESPASTSIPPTSTEPTPGVTDEVHPYSDRPSEVATPAVALPHTVSPTHTPEPYTFHETFEGHPPAPVPWNPPHWDITIHSRDRETWHSLDPMAAAHGPNCEPPPQMHPISAYEETVYQCHDHIMTAIRADGYGLIYLTPDHMVDFSEGESVIRFDMSTARASPRDWIDVWVTPYENNLQLVLDEWLPDLGGEPRHAVHIVMDFSENSMFRGEVIREFQIEALPQTAEGWQGYETFLEPSMQRRDTFELRLSETRVKFGMPDYDFWWIDTQIEPLGWSEGVVQFGHHTYNPLKDCTGCGPNTWHWDNITISPATPFIILPADQRYIEGNDGEESQLTAVSSTGATSVNFAAPAPKNAHLRFAGIGNDLELSFDDGITWEAAQLQAQKRLTDEHFKSYWTAVPAGTTSVKFRGSNWWGGKWHIRDISIWAPV